MLGSLTDVPGADGRANADRLFPPAAVRALAELLPDARVVEIPGSGHSPCFEDPALWNLAVRRFLHTVGCIGRNAGAIHRRGEDAAFRGTPGGTWPSLRPSSPSSRSRSG